jgi:hypothetical protein
MCACYRAYENGRPARIEHFLPWSPAGTKEGELTFVSGHPGSTHRQYTRAEIEFLRDVQYPYVVPRLKRLEVRLLAWGARSAENERRARDDLFGVQNSRKVYDGMQAGLYSPAFLQAKVAQERALLDRQGDRAGGAAVRAAYDRIAEAVAAQRRSFTRYRLLEGAHAFLGDSFAYARKLLRAGDELPKPNGERLKEYGDAGRESFELELFSAKPVHADLETLLLTDSLTLLVELLGFPDPLVQRVLAGRAPAERAAALIAETRVREATFRRELHAGGAAAVAAARDPMIELARLVDADARALRREWEAAEETRRQAHAVIEQARFALEGPNRAPDATFTLRLSYGPVRGYEEDGRAVPAYTTLAGKFARSRQHGGRPPFDLPARWREKEKALDLATPYNFVHTPDIIGGNSGSPVVNAAGRVRRHHLRRQPPEPSGGLCLRGDADARGERRQPGHPRGAAEGVRGRGAGDRAAHGPAAGVKDGARIGSAPTASGDPLRDGAAADVAASEPGDKMAARCGHAFASAPAWRRSPKPGCPRAKGGRGGGRLTRRPAGRKRRRRVRPAAPAVRGSVPCGSCAPGLRSSRPADRPGGRPAAGAVA